ncbi:hypothetical protein HID58_074320 [Brassica napus]|uniref:F-box associated beta-propeller type 1 domain-containing protein n=1 Tax=Brassica napus TaxID=3708 RepID=A0ABQ7YJ55_BRANA|nr:hypothetical protein HID58_074320 [Brassica napus]
MSLKRLRSTCKRWNALFKDSRFTDKHFLKAGKQSLVLTLKVSGVMLASFSLNVDDPSIEIKVQLSLKDSHSGSVCLLDIFHCNGLLLCTTTRNNRIVVCNPWLEKPDGSKSNLITWVGLVHGGFLMLTL